MATQVRTDADGRSYRADGPDLPEGAKVAISCSPTRGIEGTLLLGEELLDRGFEIVPHLAAWLVADSAHLEEIVRWLED